MRQCTNVIKQNIFLFFDSEKWRYFPPVTYNNIVKPNTRWKSLKILNVCIIIQIWNICLPWSSLAAYATRILFEDANVWRESRCPLNIGSAHRPWVNMTSFRLENPSRISLQKDKLTLDSTEIEIYIPLRNGSDCVTLFDWNLLRNICDGKILAKV